MFRKSLLIATLLGTTMLTIPTIASAYFPPPTGGTTAVPPDPFTPPTTGGVGEPEVPEPEGQPTVATPEPSSIVTAATAMLMLAGYALHRRRQLAA